MNEITGPPKADTVVLNLMFRNGRAFAAPAGTLHDLDAWRPVKSLEELAEFLNVDFRARGVEW